MAASGAAKAARAAKGVATGVRVARAAMPGVLVDGRAVRVVTAAWAVETVVWAARAAPEAVVERVDEVVVPEAVVGRADDEAGRAAMAGMAEEGAAKEPGAEGADTADWVACSRSPRSPYYECNPHSSVGTWAEPPARALVVHHNVVRFATRIL